MQAQGLGKKTLGAELRVAEGSGPPTGASAVWLGARDGTVSMETGMLQPGKERRQMGWVGLPPPQALS